MSLLNLSLGKFIFGNSLIENCSDEIVEGPYIQSIEEMLSDKNRFEKINTGMENILNYLQNKME